MTQTAVEWLVEQLSKKTKDLKMELHVHCGEIIEQAKEIEKNDTDNKAIHFGEWLTNKHTGVLITLYERFEEEHYKSE
jgi:hypothetical protein